MIKAVLFDLDGTLLNIETDAFLASYMQRLAVYCIKIGINMQPEEIAKQIWKASNAAIASTDYQLSNSQVFWQCFQSETGLDQEIYEPLFQRFYATEFNELGRDFIAEPRANQCIEMLKRKNKKLILATNPLFPRIAVKARLGWAGVDADAFELITDYENMHATKPDAQYYKEIINLIDIEAKECAMVGNDGKEDMIAISLGMQGFYLEENPLNEAFVPEGCSRGSYDDLLKWADELG